MDYLNRSMPILGDDGYKSLESSKVLIAGLGGVGGLTFLTLVRSGVGNFNITDGGIFDPPDMNRQVLASIDTMGSDKSSVYLDYAYQINPKVNIKVAPGGLTLDNADILMQDCDLFIRVMDYKNDKDVKALSVLLVDKYNIPMFQAFTSGMGGVLYNYKRGAMNTDSFWKMLLEKRDKWVKYLLPQEIKERNLAGFKTGKPPSMAIGANTASLLLSSHALKYLLRNTDLVDSLPIYIPKFAIFDPFQMVFKIMDVTQL